MAFPKRVSPRAAVPAILALAAAMVCEAQTFQVLYTFGGGSDGAEPYGTPLLSSGASGAQLFGTTLLGGSPSNVGTVFRLDLESGTETILHAFGSVTPDGWDPWSGLIQDSAGNLYGTTAYNSEAGGDGSVYKIDTAGGFSIVHMFQADTQAGRFPFAGLTLDSAGNLYGTTLGSKHYRWGSVFEVNAAGNFSTLHMFRTRKLGVAPNSALLLIDGALYGTTESGGTHNHGTVFRIDPTTGAQTVLYSFRGGADGGVPLAGVITDGNGNLYGTTDRGGQCGVVYALNLASRKETVLHAFAGTDGCHSQAGLARDAQGNLYGTASGGGSTTGICPVAGCGTVFKIDAEGDFSVLYSFTGAADGESPIAGLALDGSGNLYGAASAGGNRSGSCGGGGCGTIFQITP